MDVIVGTAGHIDHGKTALVKTLTGIDADRLPEEKRRGITVDLGFAEMTVGDVHFGFVDVPGHERFVKNMLAGASGVDLVLLVVAADEGVMPQTREHFDICRLLDVRGGVVALTKMDLVDSDTIEIARLDVAELVANSFLEGAPVIPVSSKSGEGLSELREALITAARGPGRAVDDRDSIVTRLSIDRSFTMKGFGTVVTGTLFSGSLTESDEIELLPVGRRVRVRGLQTHGRTVSSAHAGQRVAVNLAGVDHDEVTRGMTLAVPDVLKPTQIVDAEVEVLGDAVKPLRSRQRVRFHIGTAEALARLHVLNEAGEIGPGSTDFVQLRFEASVVATPGERFIIRSYSPQRTVAGGRVIDTHAVRHRGKQRDETRRQLAQLAAAIDDPTATVRLLVDAAGDSGLTFQDLQSRTALNDRALEAAIDANVFATNIVKAGGHLIIPTRFQRLKHAAETAIAQFHKREPLAKGAGREAIRQRLFHHVADDVLEAVLISLETAGIIIIDKDTIRLARHAANLLPEEAAAIEKMRSAYRNAGLEVAKVDDIMTSVTGARITPHKARSLIQTLLDSGEIVKVTDEFYFSRTVIDDLKSKIKQFGATSSDRSIDVAKFKDLAGVSRKYAIPLLEYFDRERVTQRVGDKRIIL